MSLDENLISALSDTISELQKDAPRPIPANVIASLAPVARPGTRFKIDLEASRLIGAPLISVQTNKTGLDLSALTPRQREVAHLVIKGLPNKEIALALKISPATVKDHVHAILTRLHLSSRTALIVKARSQSA